MIIGIQISVLVAEGADQEAQQHGEGDGLGRRGHEAGDVGRRALVDVGHPLVERHDARS